MQANLIKLDLSICIYNQDHKLDVMHDTKTKAAAANVLHWDIPSYCMSLRLKLN